MARLSPPESLRTRPQFLNVQTTGKRFRGHHVMVLVKSSPEGSQRLGFTVSRKVGNAVVRNRVRRRLKEITRVHQHQLCPATDHVIIASPRAASIDFSTLEREVLQLLTQAREWVSSQAC